jgi:type I restriction enzyme, S subunit
MNTKRAPKVRFKGFTDAWELRKFESIAARASSISADPTLPRVEYEDIISGIGLLNKDVKLKGISKPGIVFNQGDILYGKLRPYLHNWFLPSFSGLAVGDFWVLQPKDADSSFLFRLIQGQQFDDVANQSIGTKMPRADWNLVSKTLFFVPTSIDEQALIGRYFRSIDNLITLHQRKLDKMKELKKAFLNLIFSQKLRFYGFTDSWELRKLEEVAPLRGGYAFQSNQYANEGIPIVRISNILSDGSVGGEFVFHNELKDDEIFMLENGDIVLAMSGATTGKVSILSSEKSCKYYQNQRVGLFSKTATCNYSFVATIVRSEKFLEQLRDVLVAGAQPNVSAKDIDAFDFSVPKDVEEQSQIGNFFRTLDRLITLYQKKIDSSKEMKKILLKNMLI